MDVPVPQFDVLQTLQFQVRMISFEIEGKFSEMEAAVCMVHED